MKYEKPSVMTLASATQAIQTHDGAKDGPAFDLVIPNDPRTSSTAYEADE